MLCLPVETQIQIVGELETRSILQCRKVCQSLKSLIDKSIELQYKIELGLAGMADGPPGRSSLQHRLDALRALRVAWRDGAHPVQEVDVPAMWNVYHSPYTVIAYYNPGDAEPSLEVEVPAAPFCGTAGWSQSIARWAEIIAGRPGRRVFQGDVGQDLLVCSWHGEQGTGGNHSSTHVPQGLPSVECSFLSLSHNLAPHPLAQRPTITHPLPDGAHVPADSHLQIIGDLVLWTVSPVCRSTNVRVMNWKTGVVVWHAQIYPYNKSARLITETLLVVYRGNSSRIHLYSFDPTLCEDAVSSTLDDYPAARAFLLPEFGDNLYPSFGLECLIQHPVPIPPHEQPFFAPDPALTILALNIRTTPLLPPDGQPVRVGVHGTLPTELHILFIPVDTLVKHTERSRDQIPTSEQRAVPWDDWGPEGTRMIKADTNGSSSVLGSRYILLEKVDDGQETCEKVTIYEVFPLARHKYRRSQSHRVGEGGSPHMRNGGADADGTVNDSEEDWIRDSLTWKHPLRTTYPFRKTTKTTKIKRPADPLAFPRPLLTPDGVVLMRPG